MAEVTRFLKEYLVENSSTERHYFNLPDGSGPNTIFTPLYAKKNGTNAIQIGEIYSTSNKGNRCRFQRII